MFIYFISGTVSNAFSGKYVVLFLLFDVVPKSNRSYYNFRSDRDRLLTAHRLFESFMNCLVYLACQTALSQKHVQPRAKQAKFQRSFGLHYYNEFDQFQSACIDD